MLQSPCYQDSIDSGTQRTLVDAAEQPLYAWDAEDRRTEMIYDELRRPVQKKITENSVTKTLEIYTFGEGQIDNKINNLRGQLYKHYDGSGLQQINAYDFKGNPLETEQQFLEDATLSDADWSSNPVLSVETFTSAITYDALNRAITQTDPGGNVQAFTYDKGGLLKSIKLNNKNYVNDIHYDAKGQRQAIWYGNGTKTSYTYDVFTFRLRRLLTVNLNTNDILQDLNYWYDPVGNITEIQDDAQQILFFNNSIITPSQKFVYDALYRLIEAKGRELIGTADFGGTDNWNDAAWQTTHKGDGSAVQNYIQKYTYDEVGNVLELQHIAETGSYTRTYNYDVNSNKLLSTEVGSNTYSYSHDVRGNMIEMPHLSSLAWNTQNELKSIVKGSEPTYYQYSNGERIRKFTDKGTIKEERIYLENFEIYRKFEGGSLKIERQTVHVNDDVGRIAMLEKRTFGSAADDNDTAESLERYVYSNHLQSARLELDESGSIISYEEYHPYGTTSYQAMNTSIHAVAKRYRYTGKERDEESGLYYHGARYYIPWLCRWTAGDPLAEKYPSISTYAYVANNPIIFIDPDGRRIVVAQEADRELFMSYLNEIWGEGNFTFNSDNVLEFTGNTKGLSRKQKKALKTFRKAVDADYDINVKLSNFSDEEAEMLSPKENVLASEGGGLSLISLDNEGNVLGANVLVDPSKVTDIPLFEKGYVYLDDNNQPVVGASSCPPGKNCGVSHSAVLNSNGKASTAQKSASATVMHEIAHPLYEGKNQEDVLKFENLIRNILGIDQRSASDPEHNYNTE